MSQTDLDRLIPLESTFNFRDVGGYRAGDGQVVRHRQLFRSDALHRLTPADTEAVRSLGLRTVIDLRTDEEVAAGRFPVEDIPVAWHQFSIIDVLWDPEHAPAEHDAFAEFLFRRYVEMTESRGAQFAAAVEVLAEPGALPAVFHCAAGKDRTGMLAALVLSGLGVADDDVVADYALSQTAIERLKTWAATESPDLAARIAAQPAAHLAADPDAMRLVLRWIREQHGSTAKFLGVLGVADDALPALASQLLVPAA